MGSCFQLPNFSFIFLCDLEGIVSHIGGIHLDPGSACDDHGAGFVRGYCYSIVAIYTQVHAIGDFLILRAIRETGGTAIAVSDEAITADQVKLVETEGIVAAPEGAATLAALKVALQDGSGDKSERVLLFNTGSGLKYPMNYKPIKVDISRPVDYGKLIAKTE